MRALVLILAFFTSSFTFAGEKECAQHLEFRDFSTLDKPVYISVWLDEKEMDAKTGSGISMWAGFYGLLQQWRLTLPIGNVHGEKVYRGESTLLAAMYLSTLSPVAKIKLESHEQSKLSFFLDSEVGEEFKPVKGQIVLPWFKTRQELMKSVPLQKFSPESQEVILSLTL